MLLEMRRQEIAETMEKLINQIPDSDELIVSGNTFKKIVKDTYDMSEYLRCAYVRGLYNYFTQHKISKYTV